MYNPAPALGLKPQSPNEEIKRKAFEFVKNIGYVILGTTSLDGKTPTSRGIEIHSLDDEGNLYIGISKGKPVYDEIKQYPYVVATIVRETIKRLSISVRITGRVEEIANSFLINRYWELNPGTKKMYQKDLKNFKLFKFVEGDGEIFHVYEDDKIARLRFSFGGEKIRPFRYNISEKCINCGICAEACLTNAIEEDTSWHIINHFKCLECGKCYEICPERAVNKLY